MGGLFNNCQKGAQLRTTAIEMKHPQPPTPVATDNSAAESVLNGTTKQKRSRAIDMRFYWVRDRIRQGQFHVFWEAGKKCGRLLHETPRSFPPPSHAPNSTPPNRPRPTKRSRQKPSLPARVC
eukprot:scaffold61947_cov63-Attheya_sp.AAC.5